MAEHMSEGALRIDGHPVGRPGYTASLVAQNRAGILRDVGPEKRNPHLAMALPVAMKSLNKSPLCADLVHCTLVSR
jgi:hypothetical protein